MDAKQNISSIRHFLKKRHWVSDVFAGMCLVGKTENHHLEERRNCLRVRFRGLPRKLRENDEIVPS